MKEEKLRASPLFSFLALPDLPISLRPDFSHTLRTLKHPIRHGKLRIS
jgi:hypothetical protein